MKHFAALVSSLILVLSFQNCQKSVSDSTSEASKLSDTLDPVMPVLCVGGCVPLPEPREEQALAKLQVSDYQDPRSGPPAPGAPTNNSWIYISRSGQVWTHREIATGFSEVYNTTLSPEDFRNFSDHLLLAQEDVHWRATGALCPQPAPQMVALMYSYSIYPNIGSGIEISNKGSFCPQGAYSNGRHSQAVIDLLDALANEYL